MAVGTKRARSIRRLVYLNKFEAKPENRSYFTKGGRQLYADAKRRDYQHLKGRRATSAGQ